MRQLDTAELKAVSGGANKPASHPFPPGQHPSKKHPHHPGSKHPVHHPSNKR
jgi:hypothetical protein